MLFFVMEEVKIDFVRPTVSLAQITMIKQTFQMYEELKSQGKLVACYTFADFPGGITIWDVQSNEELQQLLFLLPSMPLVNRTVRPLTELSNASKIIDELESIVSSMPYEKERLGA
jgi:muconolactone delta-isomerase